MRLFEIIMAAAAAISIIDLLFARKNRAGVLLPSAVIAAAAASITIEGYRLFMMPAYLLSLILFVRGAVRLIHRKNTTDSKPLKLTVSISLVFLYIVSLALAVLFPVMDLPEPSGSYPVGTALMAFTDTSRAGSPAGSAQYRNIPVRIWYPSLDSSRKQRANWINNSEISSLFTECKNIPDILDQLTLVKTNSYMNIGLSDKEKEYPVVLFSGGGAMFNGQNVVQMEELASHGYIACAVGHPYDDFACEYPDGTIIPYDTEHLKALGEEIKASLEAARKVYGEDSKHPDLIRHVLRNCTLNKNDAIKWSEDMSFVADELTKLDSSNSSMFSGKLDLERLGILGHSFGGAAAGEACLRDYRFKAFINMDGAPFGTAVDNVISQPFMILTTVKNEKNIIRNGYSTDQKVSIR